MNDICVKYGVIVASDEIHCDFVWPGHTHTCFGLLNPNAVIATAPSKTFNLAGVKVANIIAADHKMRRKMDKILNVNGICEISPFAVDAVIAAYNEGEEWLEALKKYLYDNYLYLKEFVEAELPAIKILPLEATYLVWMDFSALGLTSHTISASLLKDENLWVNEGIMYGANGEGFIRLNIACPRQLLQEGLLKIKNWYTCRINR
jgi:cystathionine beta-lyase